MAERRMFSAKVVCSDAFMSLPKSAQALYFQICMRADDDGFLNNSWQIVKSSDARPADLRTLISKRFLLEFPGGIILIKHWRMANSLKRDRAKPPLYPAIAASVYIKQNKSYTDHPVEGCQTLMEYKAGYLVTQDQHRNPDGIQTESQKESNGIHLESGWNPKRIEENRTEENRREENRTEGAWESTRGDQPSPESIVKMFFTTRREIAPDPMPAQLVDKAKALLDRGVTKEQFENVFKISRHGFLSGDNKSGWKATAGWILDPDNFAKVQSGQYGSTPAARMADWVDMGTAGLGQLEREAIARMLREQEEEGNSV